jgi:hypothetical protein
VNPLPHPLCGYRQFALIGPLTTSQSGPHCVQACPLRRPTCPQRSVLGGRGQASLPEITRWCMPSKRYREGDGPRGRRSGSPYKENGVAGYFQSIRRVALRYPSPLWNPEEKRRGGRLSAKGEEANRWDPEHYGSPLSCNLIHARLIDANADKKIVGLIGKRPPIKVTIFPSTTTPCDQRRTLGYMPNARLTCKNTVLTKTFPTC